MSDRELVWEGCVNVRDLGGLPTDDGAETAYGSVVRADDLAGLSDAGWETLTTYGVRRIIDLRWPHEVAEGPHRHSGAEILYVSLFGEAWDGLDADRRFTGIADYAKRREALYLDRLDRFRHRFGQAVRAVAGAPAGCVAIHCAGGVDRTGLVSALLLRLVGVVSADIAEDYAQSEPSWAPRVTAWIEEAPDDGMRESRLFLAAVPAAAMAGVLETLDVRYGGAEGYLRMAGLGDDDLDAARARLRP